MNKLLVLAGIFLLCSLMNLANVWITGNGFSLVLGVCWLAASAYAFLSYRKMKNKDNQEDREESK